MIRPVRFSYNEQTAVNNYYQHVIEGVSVTEIQERALKEFDEFAELLNSKGVRVIIVNDTLQPETPDSIFPNNWVSFHADGRVGLYPMFAENRRLERRMDIFKKLEEGHLLKVSSFEDFSGYEKDNIYLEGTGSMVLDRVNRIAYAAISPRTDRRVLNDFCSRFDYRAVIFGANQTVEGKRVPIYHTNVMMCVGDTFAVLCADCIDDRQEREHVTAALEQSGKEIIYISEEQVKNFAGNMLELCAGDDPERKFVVMSSSAFASLDPSQKASLQRHAEIVHSPLYTIEALGGGSARCMMAEVFLPESDQL